MSSATVMGAQHIENRLIYASAFINRAVQPRATPWGMAGPAEFPGVSEALDGYGERLAAARQALGFRTQAEFARELGISTPRYNHWEKNQNPPKGGALIMLASRFGIGADWILWGDFHGLSARALQGLLNMANEREGNPVAREVREALRFEAERELHAKNLAEPPRPPILRYVRLRPD